MNEENQPVATLAAKVDEWLAALEAGEESRLLDQLTSQYPGETAELLEALPLAERRQVWELVSSELQAVVLPHLHDEVRASLLEQMPPELIVAAGQNMDVDELGAVAGDLSDDVVDTLLDGLDQENRLRLERQLAFPEHSAGRLMKTDLVTVRPDLSVETVLRYFRRRQLGKQIEGVFVTDRDSKLLGALRFATLLNAQPKQEIAELMNPDVTTVSPATTEQELTRLFEHRDLVTVAVTDEEKRLLGRVTVEDVIPMIRDQADDLLLKSSGLDAEEDLFAPVLVSTQRRAVWLGINLITAFMAAAVIGLFEATLEKVVALAVLMPVVASMGGIAGSQTLTLVIRGLALGQVSMANAGRLLWQEISVGGINGVIWAIVVALVAVLWFGDWGLGAIIAVAMLVNLLAAAASGIVVPLLLDRFGADPALSGAVVLTTVTDIVGFMTFLGLGTLFLL